MTETRKPLIGINGDFRPAGKDSLPLSWFYSGYYDRVMAANPSGVPLLIPPLQDPGDIRQLLEELDGLILAGSRLDLDPKALNMEPHPATRPMPARREKFDRTLCEMAVEMRIPILAIGSGMQLLNVVCGGTLHQHISESIPKALPHRDSVEAELRHVLLIEEGTLMFDIYGPMEIRVNSQHHMAVDRVAEPFRACAHAPDGVIEAYESVDPDWFCLGVQWHPECDVAAALDIQVFNAFIERCHGESQPATVPFPAAKKSAAPRRKRVAKAA